MYNVPFHVLQVNGEMVNLPIVLGDGEVVVVQRGSTAVLETNFGLLVSFDWNSKFVITLPSSYYGLVCGLCGNFNSKPDDERLNPAGAPVPSVTEWGQSWQTPDQDKNHPCICEKDCGTCSKDQEKLYETGAFCGALTDNSVFKTCHAKLDPQTFKSDCVYDMCFNNGDKKLLCRALASYSEQCRAEGIIIKDWRKKFGCREYFRNILAISYLKCFFFWLIPV